MENRIWQWHFEIKGLIPDQVKLKRKVWLKRGELFLEKKGDKLQAFLLGEDKYPYNESEKVLSYLRFSCLISGNAPDLEGKGGIGLKSISDFGKKKKFYNTSSRIVLPKEAVAEIESHAHKFIGFIGNIHNKYIYIVSNNDFIAVALDYYYEAEKNLFTATKDSLVP
ncbi:hypothetical protein [Desulfonatronum thiodismutans]|uniref:hypothetical protein n=1 Tax=Desulfonatronum thiodismutans TaxID=159290 RepID=UPI00126979FF|nr:hypothetical protein [Desulfonatronum thiodismutans]